MEGKYPKIAYADGFEPWGWMLGTGIYVDDVDEIFWGKALGTGVLILVLVVLVGGASALIARGIVRPLTGMTGIMGRIAADDLEVEVAGQDRGDEIGAMAKAVQVFKENAIQRTELEVHQRLERQAHEQRIQRTMELIRTFDGDVAGVLEALRGGATEMQSAS